MDERKQLASHNGMTIEFVNWFFDHKKEGCGNVWFLMMCAMWEGWKGSRDTIEIELPSLKQSESGERYVWSDGVSNFKKDTIDRLRAAGLKVKEE